ncbi:hypothetical protein H5410_004738, partial [Solanum commersonii]
TIKSKVLFSYSSRYSKIVTKRSKILFCYLSRYSKPLWDIDEIFSHFRSFTKRRFFFVIHHDIIKSFVQVKKNLRHFCIVYVCFLIFRSFWGIYVIFSHFQGIYVILGHFRTAMRFSIVYVCFLIFRPFWGIYIIFDHFGQLRKESKFCSVICDDILRSLVQLQKEVKFCSLIRHDILRSLVQGIYVIFGHFRVVTKEIKFSSLIRHDILRLLVQVKKISRRFCIVYMCFLIFSSFWGIYVIFGNFLAITKKITKTTKVFFCYSSRYSKAGTKDLRNISPFSVIYEKK